MKKVTIEEWKLYEEYNEGKRDGKEETIEDVCNYLSNLNIADYVYMSGKKVVFAKKEFVEDLRKTIERL